MEFDQVPARGGGRSAARRIEQSSCAHLRNRHGLHVGFLGCGDFDRDVGLLKAGDLIVVWFFGVSFVRRTVGQVQVQPSRPFADQNSLLRLPDAWGSGCAVVGEEHALPDRRSRSSMHVLHVQHDLRKALVEHSRLHFERSLRGFQAILHAGQRCLRGGREIHAIHQRQQPSAQHENGKDAQKRPDPDPAGTHGGDFAVGGQAA